MHDTDFADATKLARLEDPIELGDQRRILADPPLAILPPLGGYGREWDETAAGPAAACRMPSFVPRAPMKAMALTMPARFISASALSGSFK